MAWLEAHQELRDHPKTKRAARTLGISRPQMIGHLLCLWWWCLDYAETGSLADFDNDDIADAAAWEGDPDTFVSALLNCGPADRPGFLIDTGAGLTVNDWGEYGGKYVTKRAQGRERQRTHRQRNASVTQGNASVTQGNTGETQGNALVTRDSSVSNTPRVDKIIVDEIRGDESIAHAPPRGSQPALPSDPEFGNAIAALQTLGPVAGTSQMEFNDLWPDLTNGRRGWVQDAVDVAIAMDKRSVAYAVRVLSNALRDNKRPGSVPERGPARRSNGVTSADLDAIAGVDIHGNPVNHKH